MTQHMNIADEGARFVVVPSTRKITVPPVYKIIGSVGDHNSEQLTFECPRYIDGHDVSECTNHYIKCTNVLGTTGTSAVDGITVENDLVFFTWTVPAWVTVAPGSISLTLYFEDIDQEGNLLYRWSSATCAECEIVASLIDPNYGENMPQPIPIGYLKPDGTVDIQGDGEFDIKPYANARVNVTTGFFNISGNWESDEIEVAVEQIENESSRVVRIGDIFIASESECIPFYQVQANNDGLTYTAKKVGYMQGKAATVAVGAVETGEPGTAVEVENVGTPDAAVFDFKIPAGSPFLVYTETIEVGQDPRVGGTSGLHKSKYSCEPRTSDYGMYMWRNSNTGDMFIVFFKVGNMNEVMANATTLFFVKVTGSQGEPGLTPHIGDNGNWWIGTTDTGVSAGGSSGGSGQPGQNGITPHIGADGYWYIGTTNTNVKAQGQDGHTPVITIVDGYWYVDGVNTNQVAQGIQGEKGEQGQPGHTPTITIVNGYWHIDGVNTNVKAEGQDGQNGQNGQDGQNGITPHIGENNNWWIGDTDTGVRAAGVDVQVATNSTAGIVKPDGETITVDSDGTIHAAGGSGGGEMVIDLGNFTDVTLGACHTYETGHSFTVSAETLQQINDNFADNALTVIWSVNNVRHFRAKLSYANQSSRTPVYSADADLWSTLSNYPDTIRLRFCSSVQINAETGEGKLFYTVFDRMFPQPTGPSQVLITPTVAQWTVDGKPLYGFNWGDLPKATNTTAGAIKYDDSTLVMNSDGQLSVAESLLGGGSGGAFTLLIQTTSGTTSGTITEEQFNSSILPPFMAMVDGDASHLANLGVIVLFGTLETSELVENYKFASLDNMNGAIIYSNVTATGIKTLTISLADMSWTITTKTF